MKNPEKKDLKVTASYKTENDELTTLCLKGKTANSFLKLVRAGKRGITPQDVLPKNTRLAVNIFTFRTRHGLDITSQPEGDSRYSRYTLRTQVTITSVTGQYFD